MKTLPFRVHKFNGAGNVFLAIDARANSSFLSWEKSQKRSRTELTQKLCRRENGAADGLIFFTQDQSEMEIRWDFYNADGSSAEMCGNAARCAGLFAQEVFSIQKTPLRLQTLAGSVEINRRDNLWEVEMPALSAPPRLCQVQTSQGVISGFYVNTGVPHFVVEIKIASDRLDQKLCREIRNHADFLPGGANVTLSDGLEAVTYERGVEDFTAACGTGAVAAAVVRSQGQGGQHQVRMPGGDLWVDLSGPRPKLSGPTEWIGDMEINQEILK